MSMLVFQQKVYIIFSCTASNACAHLCVAIYAKICYSHIKHLSFDNEDNSKLLNKIEFHYNKFSLKTFHVDTLEVHGLFFIILGMFFMLTSYIFTQARQYKQENDLTI